jgi:hypothetical protein
LSGGTEKPQTGFYGVVKTIDYVEEEEEEEEEDSAAEPSRAAERDRDYV